MSVTGRPQGLLIRRYQDADHDAVWALCGGQVFGEQRSKRMRVAPHVQGHGFGRLIPDRQLVAQALYRRYGYRETGRQRRDQFKVIFFEKPLAHDDRHS
jgi:GNAT superfamily N-acetyltransferase